MKYLYLVLSFTLVLQSCNNSGVKTNNNKFSKSQIASLNLNNTKIANSNNETAIVLNINDYLDKREFDFMSMIDSVICIPLETTKKSLVDRVDKILLTEDRIFIKDRYSQGGVIIFNSDGEFIHRIPNGRGPGELLRLYDIAYDKVTNQLITYEHSFISYFDKNGKLISERSLPFGIDKIYSYNQGYIAKGAGSGNGHLGKIQNYSFFDITKDLEISCAGIKEINPSFSYVEKDYVSQIDDSLFLVASRLNDTIYRYNVMNKDLVSKYILDYSNGKIYTDYSKMTNKQIQEFFKTNDTYYFNGWFTETKNTEAFFLYNSFRNSTAVVFRNKHSGEMTGGSIAKYDIAQIPPLAFMYYSYKQYFVHWYNPSSEDPFAKMSTIIDEESKMKLQKLDTNSNPVIVLYTMKDF